MESPLATRIFWTAKESGMPLPTFSEDDVTNFLITEALVTRAARERTEAQKNREKQNWMKGSKDWAKEAGLLEGGSR